MPILTVILVILAVGVLVALINKYGPPYIAPGFIVLINVVAIVATIIWVLKVAGFWAYLSTITI
jgi:hypothetical protein